MELVADWGGREGPRTPTPSAPPPRPKGKKQAGNRTTECYPGLFEETFIICPLLMPWLLQGQADGESLGCIFLSSASGSSMVSIWGSHRFARAVLAGKASSCELDLLVFNHPSPIRLFSRWKNLCAGVTGIQADPGSRQPPVTCRSGSSFEPFGGPERPPFPKPKGLHFFRRREVCRWMRLPR